MDLASSIARLLTVSLVLVASASAVPPGVVDTTFQEGAQAYMTTRPVARLDDGRIIVIGSFTSYAGTSRPCIARLTPNGALDRTFDPGTGSNLSGSSLSSAVLLPDGKLLVSGGFGSFNGVARSYLVKLNSDGSVDTTWDAHLHPAGSRTSSVSSLAVQPDGAILIGGLFSLPGETLARCVARLRPDGTPDWNFSSSVSATYFFGFELQPDGKLLVAGDVTTPEDTSRTALMRLLRDGSLDRSFTPALGAVILSAIAQQPDGKVLVGCIQRGSGQAVLRLMPDGSADPAWPSAPPQAMIASSVDAVAVQPDGKILFAGVLSTATGYAPMGRLNADGTFDASFQAALTGTFYRTMSMLIEPSGSVVAGGSVAFYNQYMPGLFRMYGGEAASAGAGVLGFAWSNQIVAEGAGTAYVAVTRTGGNAGAVTVDYATSDGTAAEGADYSASTGTLHFADGETTKLIDVPIADDALNEGDEAFSVMLSAPGGGASLGLVTATVTIADDDQAGRFQWRLLSGTVKESDPGVALDISRSGETRGPVTVDYTTVSGTATAGTDFVAKSGTISFADGENLKTISISLLEDMTKDGRESFTIVLSNPTGGATLSAESTRSITIIDNDGPGKIVTDFNAGSLGSGGDSILTMAALPDGKAMVGGSFETFGGVTRRGLVRLNADGAVDTGFDAQLPSGGSVYQIVRQPDGRLLALGRNLRPGVTGTYIVRFLPDGALDATFNSTLISPNTTQSLTINRFALQPDGRILVAGYLLTRNGVNDRNLVRLNADGSEDLSLDYNVAGSAPTAIAVQADGRILLGNFGSLSRIHPGGELDVQMLVPPLNVNSIPGGIARVSGLIVQPDGKILATGWFPLTYPAAIRGLMRFNADGTIDTSFQGPVANASGDVRAVALLDDGRIVAVVNNVLERLNPDGSVDWTFEPVTSFSPVLTTALPSGDVLVTRSSPARVMKILGGQVDSTAPAQFSFTWPQMRISESAAAVSVSVTRLGDTANAVSVDFATADQTAQAGVDYTAASGTLSFGPGETTKSFEVPILDNAIVNGPRAFQVSLSNPSTPAQINGGAASVTIFDDEHPGVFQLEKSSYTLREGGPGVVVKVLRTVGSQGEVSVAIATVDGKATAGSDFTPVAQTLTFPPGVTEMSVTLQAPSDGAVEGDETFSIQLTNPTGYAELGARASAPVTIVDIDDPGSYLASLAPLFPSAFIRATLTLPDGRVLIGGNFTTADRRWTSLARLTADGALDDTFQPLYIGGTVNAIAVQPDGRILVGGLFNSVNKVSIFDLVRLMPDGTPDPTFVSPMTTNANGISALGLESHGRIIIAGNFFTVQNVERRGLARLESNGTLDQTFKPPVTTDVSAFVVTSGDQVIYAGAGNQLVRLFGNGGVDRSFLTTTGSGSSSQAINAMAIDAAGRITISGAFTTVNGLRRLGAARLLSDGRVDPTFDASDSVSAAADAMVLNADGTLYWAPNSQLNPRGPVVRLLANGALDPAFREMKSTTDVHITALAVLPARGLLVAGYFSSIDGVADPGLALLRLEPQPGVFHFADPADVTVAEGGAVQVTVQRIGGSAGPATVRYETVNDTAVAGADFTAVSDTLLFEDGQTSASFTIHITDDQKYERTESFSVRLFEATGATLGAAEPALTVKITDDDPFQAGKLQFQQSAMTVSEEAGVLVIPVVRVQGSDESLTVSYRCTAGTARAGFDFTPVSGTLTLLDGETAGSITVPITDDLLKESAETFTVTLTGDAVGDPAVVTVTIEDVDTAVVENLKGTFRGMSRDAGSASIGRSIAVTLGARRSFTGALDFGTDRFAFHGTLDSDGRALLTIPVRGGTPITLILQLDVAAGQGIDATIQVGQGSFDIGATRSLTTAAPAGRYNLAFESTGGGGPSGAGWAQLVMAKNGAARVVGALPDGTPWSTSTTLSVDQEAALFVPLYQRRGALEASVVFTEHDCAGTSHWVRPGDSRNSLYPFGFSVSQAVDGSAYQPVAGASALGFAQGHAVIDVTLPRLLLEADFTSTAASRLQLQTPPAQLALSINRATGLVSGQLVNPATKRLMRVQALALPDASRAVGFVTTAGADGKVELTGN